MTFYMIILNLTSKNFIKYTDQVSHVYLFVKTIKNIEKRARFPKKFYFSYFFDKPYLINNCF